MGDFFSLNTIITIIYILNIIFIITIVFFERRKNENTLMWILILAFTHVIGFLLYIFLGLSLRKRRFTKKYFKSFSFNKIKLKKGAIEDTTFHPQNNLIKLFNIKNHSFLRTGNKVKVFKHGKCFFEELIRELNEAKKYIHMEYYIFENDEIGSQIMDILVKKAEEGLKIILIYDGMGCAKVPSKFFKRLSNAGGEVQNFFPPFFSGYGLRVNYRTHRKITLVDGKCGFLGGINIGDDYLGDGKKRDYWRDTHLKIEGSGIIGLEKEFLINYDFMKNNQRFFKKKRKKDDFSIDEYLNYEEVNGETDLQIVSSGPDYEEPYIKNGIYKMISDAKKSIYIQTPYFIPDETVLNALKIAVMSGIEVNIMIPNKPDHIFVYWATLSYIGDLVKVGAKCYVYENGFLHSKVVIVDDKVCTVGSTNMDIRSFVLNFEINAFIYDPKIALELKENFLEDMKTSTLITPKKYNERSLIIKIKESISRLLSPIM